MTYRERKIALWILVLALGAELAWWQLCRLVFDHYQPATYYQACAMCPPPGHGRLASDDGA